MNKILSHPITILLFTILFIVAFSSLRKNAMRTQISTQNITFLENEITSLEEAVSASQQELEKAQQPLNREKILRNELLMQKEGEYIVQLPDLEKKQEIPEESPPSPWEEWRRLLF